MAKPWMPWLWYALAFLTSGNAIADSFFPSLDEWMNAATFSAKDPATWAPLAGAAIIKATNSDQHISDWAADKKPVFDDSNISAGQLGDGLMIMAVGTLVFSPQQPNTSLNWPEDKGLRLAEMVVSTDLAAATADEIKGAVKRRRPDNVQGESYSFPSWHATRAFSWAAITRRNLEDYDLSDSSRTLWNIGIYTMASSSAWIRVESRSHYPTDVLVGAALGNFIAGTVYRAFAGNTNHAVIVTVTPYDDSLVLNATWLLR